MRKKEDCQEIAFANSMRVCSLSSRKEYQASEVQKWSKLELWKVAKIGKKFRCGIFRS